MLEQYLAPRCTPANLDRFIIRSAILQALRDTLPRFSGRLLDVGCGHMPYRSLLSKPPSRIDTYIGLDISSEIYGTRDVEWDGFIMPFADASVDCAMAIEVLEHCPEPDTLLGEAYRVLGGGGSFFFTVPFVWPLHDTPHDQYRFTPFALERHLSRAGFDQVELRALGGWDASLAQMVGLWARRRPMSRIGRLLLSRLLLPVVATLVRVDQPPAEFRSNTMVTGLCGTAIKGV
jgi:SAM-dependent methyltransferase